jgi:hypothetical protein
MPEDSDIATVPWRDHRDGPGPGLHALVIGVSWYEHGDQEGLASLPGAAMSAARFARWLDTEYRNPEAPLHTVRVLASPVDVEDVMIRDELEGAAPAAVRTNVVAALGAWSEDCRSHPRNVALLYVAGHGCYTERDGGFVLLERFGQASDKIDDALNIRRVVDGLTTTTHAFVDACLVPPPKGISSDLGGGVKLGAPEEPAPPWRIVKQYFAAAPGRSAVVLPQQYATTFGEATLAALRRDALEDDDGAMTVRANTLLRTIRANVSKIAPEQSETYERSVTSGKPSPTDGANPMFHAPLDLDPAELFVSTNPLDAAERADGELWRGLAHDRDFRFKTQPERFEIPPGYYLIRLARTDPMAYKAMWFGTLRPGREEHTVEVEYGDR